ncbi:glycosyl transferase [Thiohalorhabdus denitrificans]|uniref:Glycosyltransferase involved in cell wall bisynthesis n=1 Tax=Thiohalorhabdus denitrificans TaxID=381306 RepID=A0A0P9CKR8_9GAMM|nr:glycosyltransferase family 4 protein [Thiohalorhabdus denitrificans]KPV39567.1 glycosyl transferase [Thiohalorhabdus denitrificans]SCX98367.1 Glycosyltransferase involved in cell wall bisynthesis [Thiohalorhabdus denitrificans]
MLVTLSANTAWYLYNFRSGVIRALMERGYRVATLAPPDAMSERLAELGCEVIDFPMDNKGNDPVQDLRTIWRYRRMYACLQPDLALHFTIKPVIYGSLGARLARVPCINTVTGLGTAFIREGWLTRMVEVLYRVSQRWPSRVFFQNGDDLELFLRRSLVRRELIGQLPGSGVDLSRFQVSAMEKIEAPVFLLVARMVWDKGVGEFVEAARILRGHYPAVRFQLLGPLGVENRTAIPHETLEEWVEEGLVEYLGEADDVRPHIARSSCVVLPSYREGTPRTMLEAAAMGRPVITTDAVGCREVVDDGESGFLCQPRDAEDLARQMTRFLELEMGERETMGVAGRAKMEREFDERIVIQRYLEAIDEAVDQAAVRPA